MATNGTAPTTGDLLQAPSGVTRVNYFYGQLLTQRDLQTEQCYQVLLRRLAQREAFGTGTVAGLNVQAVGANGPGSVYVRAGLAMDPVGRELLLTRDACVTIADPALPNNAMPYILPGSYTAAVLAPLIAQAWGVSFGPADIFNASDPASLWTRLFNAGLSELAGDTAITPPGDAYINLPAQLNKLTPTATATAQGQLLRDVLFNQLIGTTYLGLRYYERGTEPSPTVLDASCCGNAQCFPARQEEGVVIVAQQTPFPPIPDAYRHAKDELGKAFLADQNLALPPDGAPAGVVDTRRALCDYLLGHWHGLPPSDGSCNAPQPQVVPLASIYWFRFNRDAGGSRILLVDNYTTRPLAPGVPQLRALYDVSTQDIPTLPVHPRFDLIVPANNQALTMDGGSSVVVTAQANTLLATPTPSTWEIYFYPTYTPAGASPPPPSAPVYWNSANQPAASYGFTIGVTAAPDATDTFSIVSLTFATVVVSPWLTSTAYVTGNLVSSNGNVYVALTSATSGPTAPSGTAASVSDGGVNWQFLYVASASLSLPSGTYLWRLNVGGGIDAAVTGAPLDGGPNPPNAVPSGGNDPGGVNEAFEALFYV